MAKRRRDDDDNIIADVKGGGLLENFGGILMPSLFSTGRLELTSTRVIEHTKFIFYDRSAQLLLTDVQSVQMVPVPNLVLIVIGVLTLPVFGIGILPLTLAYLIMGKALVVTFASGRLVVRVTGNKSAYLDFMDAVLEEAEHVKFPSSKSSAAAPAKSSRDYDDDVAAPAPRIEAPVKNKVSAPAGDGKTTVKCPDCSAEYKLPAGSIGKKFRCQKCQAVIET